MIFFFTFFLKSEPFYLIHTEGSYIDWGRGVTQERDYHDFNYSVVLILLYMDLRNHNRVWLCSCTGFILFIEYFTTYRHIFFEHIDSNEFTSRNEYV